jgi:hypothetical protein
MGLAVGQLVGPGVEVARLGVQPGLALTESLLASLDVLPLLVQVLVQNVLPLGRPVASEEDDAEGDRGKHDQQDDDGEKDLHDAYGSDRRDRGLKFGLESVHRRAPVHYGAKQVGQAPSSTAEAGLGDATADVTAVVPEVRFSAFRLAPAWYVVIGSACSQ